MSLFANFVDMDWIKSGEFNLNLGLIDRLFVYTCSMIIAMSEHYTCISLWDF